MRRTLFVLTLFIPVAFAGSAAAQDPEIPWPDGGTPDGYPPSVETVCDGQLGAAYGLCNAYCEAMDCELALDSDPTTEPAASATACEKVKTKYEQVTGSPLPCAPAVCPCVGRFPSWDKVAAGVCDFGTDGIPGNTIPTCGALCDAVCSIDTTQPEFFYLIITVTDNVGGCGGVSLPTWCGEYEGGYQAIELSPDQEAACRDLLLTNCPA